MSVEGPHDRRSANRTPILGPLHGEVKTYQPISIREISPGGVQIETAFPLPLDALHDFRLLIGGLPIVVKGRIVHCRISDVDGDVVLYRSGVEFVDLPERIKRTLADFIDQLTRARQPLSPT